jgi:hypothetical protein
MMGRGRVLFSSTLKPGCRYPPEARVARLASETVGDLAYGEFTQYQLEVKTPPCAANIFLREQLLALRSVAAAAAAAEGLDLPAAKSPDHTRRRLCSEGTP